jgi:hypothetical protein
MLARTVRVFTSQSQRSNTRRRERAHLLITELPDRVEQRGLLAHLLDAVNSLVEEIEFVSEILQQVDLVVERCEEHTILARLYHCLDKVHRRLLLKLQLAGVDGDVSINTAT